VLAYIDAFWLIAWESLAGVLLVVFLDRHVQRVRPAAGKEARAHDVPSRGLGRPAVAAEVLEPLIAVPSSRITQRYVGVKSHLDLPGITRDQIEHFFVHYKDLEPGKWVKLLGWGGVDEARELIAAAMERAKRDH
jgi:hypothetical protein